jgi:hypothetical protein
LIPETGTNHKESAPSKPPRSGTQDEEFPVFLRRFFKLCRKVTQLVTMKKAAGTKQATAKIHFAVSTLVMLVFDTFLRRLQHAV